MIKNDLESYQPQEGKLTGIYRGVVENNVDKDGAGKCQIRVFGVHTENKRKSGLNGIPTEDLPWAEPALGLFEGSVSGYGFWTVPLQGSHVFVFFEAGHPLEPRFFATVPGIPSESPDGRQGFNDPNEQYPDKINEPDWNRLARGETAGTPIEERQNNQRDNEPAPAYAAEYPHNNVFSTPSGITVEYDDTPGEERIHIYHPSKTYIEINNDGRLVIRNTDSKYELVDKDKKINIIGNREEEIGKDSTINTQGETVDTSQEESTTNGSKVNLNRDKGAIHSIVTTGHICAITGLPHPCGSPTCFAHMNSPTESGTTN